MLLSTQGGGIGITRPATNRSEEIRLAGLPIITLASTNGSASRMLEVEAA